MANITITTTVNSEIWKEARNKGVKMSHLIGLGWRAFNDNPQLIARINELESGNLKLQSKLTRLNERLFDLEK